MLRVLSIDGGGIRGIIPATVLGALEALTGRRVMDLFDLVVGTSTGGILALAMTCPQGNGRPRSALDVRSLYVDRGASIFPLGGVPAVGLSGNALLGARPPLPVGASVADRFKHFMGHQNVAKATAPLGGRGAQGNARYPAEPLTEQLREQLGETVMSAALRPVAVVSCDVDRGTPLVFRGGGLDQGELGNAAMWHAARATSAGPTFFPPLVYTGADGVQRRCVDGGLVANDPAFVAFTEAARLLRAAGRLLDDLLLVSLGTGAKSPDRPPESDDVPQLTDTRPWTQLLPGLAEAVSAAPGELARQQLSRLLGERYVRLQTVIGHGAVHAMDDVRPANITGLVRTAEELVSGAASTLTALARAL